MRLVSWVRAVPEAASSQDTEGGLLQLSLHCPFSGAGNAALLLSPFPLHGKSYKSQDWSKVLEECMVSDRGSSWVGVGTLAWFRL